MELLLAVLALALASLCRIAWKMRKERDALTDRYSGLVDVDTKIATRTKELAATEQSVTRALAEHEKKTRDLESAYSAKRALLLRLERELGALETEKEMAEYGVYRPHFAFDDPEEFKERIKEVRAQQKALVQEKRAATCPTEWTVEGSKRAGTKMVNRTIKLMLRAFNGECDAAIAKVKWNNVTRQSERIEKAFDAIGKLGEPQHVYLTREYLDLKQTELHLTYELARKRQEEKEQQREIREQIREEQRAQKELEKALADAEAEESRYRKALEQAREEVDDGSKAEVERLQALLDEVMARKERAVSRAQLTRSGHVYIISNIGSFGEDVYKIGMTRRLEPLDRVKELGDASVPFTFDIHAMIYADDAPTLERSLHERFRDEQVNLVNSRKEFFHVPLQSIEAAARDLGVQVEFTRVAEAQQYRESLALRNERPLQEDSAGSLPDSLEEAIGLRDAAA